jgi:hypothetical protein
MKKEVVIMQFHEFGDKNNKSILVLQGITDRL